MQPKCSVPMRLELMQEQDPSEEIRGRPPDLKHPDYKHYLVQCEGFRCMAYKDADGVWREAYRGDAIPEVIRIVAEL
jgi:hypothetical protein